MAARGCLVQSELTAQVSAGQAAGKFSQRARAWKTWTLPRQPAKKGWVCFDCKKKKKKRVGLNKGQISKKEIVFGRSPPVRCFQNFGQHVWLDGRTAGRMDRWVDSCSVGSSLHLAALMNVWITAHTFTNTEGDECSIIIIWLLKWIMHLNIFFHALRSVSSSSMHQVRL